MALYINVGLKRKELYDTRVDTVAWTTAWISYAARSHYHDGYKATLIIIFSRHMDPERDRQKWNTTAPPLELIEGGRAPATSPPPTPPPCSNVLAHT